MIPGPDGPSLDPQMQPTAIDVRTMAEMPKLSFFRAKYED